ncbi:MAG: helix-turn-helix transcriptional regulator [Candidatus Gastranaerophilales bacterium]|nr:helix-turn-helix transcriptional regulator [Candidatus Gastranaerophilales bacterium]
MFSADLTKAFEEYDSKILTRTIDSIRELFQAHPQYYVQALDAASNILYLSISLLQDGEAAVFGISPNYLSQLFGKYNKTGFSEYINQCRIAKSKKLLEDGNLKVYEVADMLGFESAFYFSKVFKKVEGVSPTEYLNGKYL